MDQNLFGQILINFRIISSEQLDKCIELQRRSNPPKLLGEVLMEQGLIDQKQLNTILSVQKRKLELSKTQMRASEDVLRERLRGASMGEFLKVARELGASDMYITTGVKPMVRVNGVLVDLPAEPYNFDESRRFIQSIMSKEQIEEYYKEKDIEFSIEIESGRYRMSVFRHLNGIAVVARVIADKVWPFSKLDLPPVVRDFTTMSRGLVLVTGPAGSGKSTTLASLVDLINKTQRLRIITIEDPIEVIFQSEKCLISQRQIPGHSRSFSSALRMALREDPDVIVMGEMRDPETVSTAITAAETGHLIFGTLHTHNAQRTVLRILDQYPAQKRAHIRTLLADVLRGVISQQLVPNIDGKGRSLASEVMVANSAIANMIRDDRAWQIPMVMQTGGRQGMRLMDDSLLELVQKKKISVEEALIRATDKSRFMKPAASVG